MDYRVSFLFLCQLLEAYPSNRFLSFLELLLAIFVYDFHSLPLGFVFKYFLIFLNSFQVILPKAAFFGLASSLLTPLPLPGNFNVRFVFFLKINLFWYPNFGKFLLVLDLLYVFTY